MKALTINTLAPTNTLFNVVEKYNIGHWGKVWRAKQLAQVKLEVLAERAQVWQDYARKCGEVYAELDAGQLPEVEATSKLVELHLEAVEASPLMCATWHELATQLEQQ